MKCQYGKSYRFLRCFACTVGEAQPRRRTTNILRFDTEYSWEYLWDSHFPYGAASRSFHQPCFDPDIMRTPRLFVFSNIEFSYTSRLFSRKDVIFTYQYFHIDFLFSILFSSIFLHDAFFCFLESFCRFSNNMNAERWFLHEGSSQFSESKACTSAPFSNQKREYAEIAFLGFYTQIFLGLFQFRTISCWQVLLSQLRVVLEVRNLQRKKPWCEGTALSAVSDPCVKSADIRYIPWPVPV